MLQSLSNMMKAKFNMFNEDDIDVQVCHLIFLTNSN